MARLNVPALLVKALGHTPTTRFPEFEALFGWRLPDSVLPFVELLRDDKMPGLVGGRWCFLNDKHGMPLWRDDVYCSEEQVILAESPPWSVWSSLVNEPDAALDRLLYGPRNLALFAGLMPIAQDSGGDIGFIDVGPHAIGAGFYEWEHGMGGLNDSRESFTGFVRSQLEATAEFFEYEWDAEEDPELGPPPLTMEALEKVPTSPPDRDKRVERVSENFEKVSWVAELLWGKDEVKYSELPGDDSLLTLNAKLVASVLLNDRDGARNLCERTKQEPGVLSKALAGRVESYLRDEPFRLAWITRENLGDARKIVNDLPLRVLGR